MFQSAAFETLMTGGIIVIGAGLLMMGAAFLLLFAVRVSIRSKFRARLGLIDTEREFKSTIKQSSKAFIAERVSGTHLGLSEAEQRQIILEFKRFGISPANAAYTFVIFRLICSMVLIVLIINGLSYFMASSVPLGLLLVAFFVGGIIGWLAPLLYIDYRRKKWKKAILLGLPDALELLVVCVEAGLSLQDGLERVTRELADSRPELSAELSMTWAEVSILPNRTPAFVNLSQRIDIPEVNAVISILTQSLELGTALSQSLRFGAIELRNHQLLMLEEQASKLPALMTIPVIVFIMPTIFLIIGGPAIIQLIDIFSNMSR